MILTLFARGNSYLVFNHISASNQFNELNQYLLKLSLISESVITLKCKLHVAKKLNKFLYHISLKRILYTVKSDIANHIRNRIKSIDSIAIDDAAIEKPPFIQHPNVDGCYFEENAHDYNLLNLLLTSKKIVIRNNYHITFELKVKCALDDFIGYPNLFTIRNDLKNNNSLKLSHNPAKVFSNSTTNVSDQLLILSNETNGKYLKVYINGQIISNNQIKNQQLLDLISKTIVSSNTLTSNIIQLHSYSSGQQFIAHAIYLLLDILYQYLGHTTDSWKIYYLQRFNKFCTPNLNKTSNQIPLQIGNYNKGLTLVKSLLSTLVNTGHSELARSLNFFLKRINRLTELDFGIKYNPLVKLREFLELYSRKGYPNTSLQRRASLQSLFTKYSVIRESISWLQNYLIARTMMDCSLVYNIRNTSPGHNLIDNSKLYNDILIDLGYILSNDNYIKISIIDLDIKPYKRVKKWADDAYMAITKYNSIQL